MDKKDMVYIEFIYVCSLCKEVMRKRRKQVAADSFMAAEESIESHGICKPCYATALKELNIEEQKKDPEQ